MNATTKPSYRRPLVLGALDALAAAAVHFVRKPVQFYRTRGELTQLAGMTDHELSDIGLTRSDLITASAYPADVDPTNVLAELVQERRHWRRGQ